MRDFISDSAFDREAERARFEFVFSEINNALGPEAFKRYNESQDRFTGKFSISSFETIASGLARNEAAWRALDPIDRADRLRAAAIAVWRDAVFSARSGGGKPANRRIPYMVEVGERIFAEFAV